MIIRLHAKEETNKLISVKEKIIAWDISDYSQRNKISFKSWHPKIIGTLFNWENLTIKYLMIAQLFFTINIKF